MAEFNSYAYVVRQEASWRSLLRINKKRSEGAGKWLLKKLF